MPCFTSTQAPSIFGTSTIPDMRMQGRASHPCGHDKTSRGAGFAHESVRLRRTLRHNVRLFFRSGEKERHEARAMAAAGWTEETRHILAVQSACGPTGITLSSATMRLSRRHEIRCGIHRSRRTCGCGSPESLKLPDWRSPAPFSICTPCPDTETETPRDSGYA